MLIKELSKLLEESDDNMTLMSNSTKNDIKKLEKLVSNIRAIHLKSDYNVDYNDINLPQIEARFYEHMDLFGSYIDKAEDELKALRNIIIDGIY